MRIINWNTRGLEFKNIRRVIKYLLQKKDLEIVMFQDKKRRFVRNVWSVRNKDWAFFLAPRVLGGVLIFQNSRKLHQRGSSWLLFDSS